MPTSTLSPSITALTPNPDNSCVSDTSLLTISFPYAFFKEIAIGWFEKLSAYVAYLIKSSFDISIGFICCTSKTPSVNVPVLSNTIISVLESASK